MSWLPQRLTFQLTPLLDLLLIVIFAQYLEVKESTQQRPAPEPTAETISTAQIEQWESNIVTLEQQVADLQIELKRTRQQQKRAGNLVSELFQVDQKLIDEIFQVGQPELQPRSQQDVDQLKQAMQKLASLRGNRVIEHLLTFHELSKRADIWQIYLTEQGHSRVQLGPEKFHFSADTADDFVRRFYQRYKTIAEPKGLVLILFSYGDALEKDIRIAWEGLQQSIDKMRVDRNFRTQFEYANIGYIPTALVEIEPSPDPGEQKHE